MPSTVYDPPALESGTLRVTPLGGLGEIGRNMTVFEYDGKLLIVDCGVLFPEEHQPGVDLILPDFEPIKRRLGDVVGVVLTHGHEDHIGAVPYLLKLKQDIPIIGSGLTLALTEAKLKEHRVRPYSLTVKEGQREKLGPFDLEFIAVNHSIPDALAVAIRTPAGTVLVTGDFKMDQLPARRPADRPARVRAARRRGRRPVPRRLDQRRRSRLHAARALHRTRPRPGDRQGAAPRHRRELLEPRPPRAAGAGCRSRPWPSRRAPRAQHGAQHDDRVGSRLPPRPRGRADRLQEGPRPPRRQDRLHVDGFAGRADGGAQPHGEPRPRDRARAGRHRDPRVEPHPRQRERRLPRDRRAHQARRERRAQGQRQGARVRATRPPASCSTATTSSSPRTCCRSTASTATSSRTPSSRRTPASPPSARSSARTAPSST